MSEWSPNPTREKEATEFRMARLALLLVLSVFFAVAGAYSYDWLQSTPHGLAVYCCVSGVILFGVFMDVVMGPKQ